MFVDGQTTELYSYGQMNIVLSLPQVVSSKTSSSKMIRITSDVVIKLGPGLLELLRGILQKSQRKQRKNVQEVGKSTLHNILCHWPVLVDSFTSLLHIYSVSEQSRYPVIIPC